METPEAFAPAAITNFFSIHDEGLSVTPPDLVHVGATGGGYMLSKGVRSRAEIVPEPEGKGVSVVVNGDAGYEARTTTSAIELLLESIHESGTRVRVYQEVEVPIGYGFGARAASALSGVLAVASTFGIRKSKSDLAFHAHAADILCRTGLGTVSVIYEYGGAGIMTRAGGPGMAEVRSIPVPKDLRIVTASLAPYEKSVILSSLKMKEKVNRLGDEALVRASDLTIESLMRAGEIFSESLGLESPEIRRLAKIARMRGAIGASQNMVGHAVHSLVFEENVAAVASALQDDPLSPRVDVYEFGSPAH